MDLMTYIEVIDSPIGELCIEASEEALLSVGVGGAVGQEIRPNDVTKACSKQLFGYFMGSRRKFDLPLKLAGTNFQKAVWGELLKVEFGQTCSYSEIAEKIGRPKAQRAVGAANHVNRFPIVIPCHRIIGKDRSLTGYAQGLDIKAWLLAHEKEIQKARRIK